MILNMDKFVREEKPYWERLEGFLARLEQEPDWRLSLEEVQQFHYLYQRTSSDLVKVTALVGEPEMARYLETLVARAYGEIQETRQKRGRFGFWPWLVCGFPRTFRRHARLFQLSTALFLLGTLLGALAIQFDPEARDVLIPFAELREDPRQRVAAEERGEGIEKLKGARSRFSTMLMTHNIQIAITTMALGVSWGVGTSVMLFSNGIMLGAVGIDYVRAGQTPFMLGWLLPHGVVEIPAILLAGQAGLLLAGAMIGWAGQRSLRQRLRVISSDLVSLIGGVACLLVWAGLVEGFLSQFHQPVVPYAIKIGFGVVELVGLTLFLALAGRRLEPDEIQTSR